MIKDSRKDIACDIPRLVKSVFALGLLSVLERKFFVERVVWIRGTLARDIFPFIYPHILKCGVYADPRASHPGRMSHPAIGMH